jgi:hypothetical protein
MSSALSRKSKSAELLRRGLKSLQGKDLSRLTPCPNSWTFAQYVEGDVDAKTKEAVNAHIAFCERCYEEYLALSDPKKVMADFEEEEERELESEKGQKRPDLEKAKSRPDAQRGQSQRDSHKPQKNEYSRCTRGNNSEGDFCCPRRNVTW